MNDHIVVAGYYGFGNLGDELILTVLLHQLRQKYENPSITVFSNQPDLTARLHHVQAVSRWNPFSIFMALWSCDLFILGGGGLIQDQTSRRSLIYYMGLVKIALLCGARVLLYAVGVEKLSSPLSKRMVKNTLRHSLVAITVRDVESKEQLKAIGFEDWQMSVTQDPVFSWSTQTFQLGRQKSDETKVLLIPRFPCPSDGRRLYNVIGAIVVENPRMSLTGALFHSTVERNYLTSIQKSGSLMNVTFTEKTDVVDLAHDVADYDYVISSRYHGLVLAALAGRPFIGVGDFEKVARLCVLCGMPYLSWQATEQDARLAIQKLVGSSSAPFSSHVNEWKSRAAQSLENVS